MVEPRHCVHGSEACTFRFATILPAASAAVAVLYALCEAAVRHLEAQTLICHKRGSLQAIES